VRIHALEARQFRNLAEVLIEPHPRFNVLWGDNGQGKTNILEAIYLLGTLRSFRAARTEEMVRFGAERATARARVEKLGTQRLLEVQLSPGHKSAKVDGKGARATDYFGGFNVVLFAPEDLRLPKGPPAGRRRFVDRAVWNAHPAYLAEVQTYERVLKSRNAVLRDGATPMATKAELLEVYDEQLARAAVAIVTRRRALVTELRPLVQAAFERVTQTGLAGHLVGTARGRPGAPPRRQRGALVRLARAAARHRAGAQNRRNRILAHHIGGCAGIAARRRVVGIGPYEKRAAVRFSAIGAVPGVHYDHAFGPRPAGPRTS
jgi:DNA replication and repair protein RecF